MQHNGIVHKQGRMAMEVRKEAVKSARNDTAKELIQWDLDGLPNVPSSRYGNSDVHDANIEDGNPTNWIGKDFDDQDYGEDLEEDYIEETPAWNVIPSDESNQEEEPQEQQPSKKRKFTTPQKRRQPKKSTQTKKPPLPKERTQEKYPTKPKPKNKKKRLKRS
ncbi:unnamed protein product [Lactuca virosa]|uniref:Uncharacterized protein n=1 Tax=Lactuca virosa TaxID=75947 RepID=A0AAU9PHG5_9ASTR|nr:unnamed protein product [Lactuca virosa]